MRETKEIKLAIDTVRWSAANGLESSGLSGVEKLLLADIADMLLVMLYGEHKP